MLLVQGHLLGQIYDRAQVTFARAMDVLLQGGRTPWGNPNAAGFVSIHVGIRTRPLLLPPQFVGFSPFRAVFGARRFRRNGVAVPAQRYHRSGATVSPFRRNGVAVPAQRGGRSGATGWPFRRNGDTVPAQRHPRSGETG